ncbi:DNA-deoxyinosine glycosylase [Empedobacter falsenii]
MLQNKLALWDVAHSAERKGSMDVDMRNVSPNQIDEFLNEHPTIEKIIFNGKKAYQLFWKYFEKKTFIEYISAPSTSPANAQFSYERLIEIWKKAII